MDLDIVTSESGLISVRRAENFNSDIRIRPHKRKKGREFQIVTKIVDSVRSVLKLRLHPLIHTSPPKTLAQDSGVGQKGVDSLKMVSAVSSQSG